VDPTRVGLVPAGCLTGLAGLVGLAGFFALIAGLWTYSTLTVQPNGAGAPIRLLRPSL
jgi:hypothetical protein